MTEHRSKHVGKEDSTEATASSADEDGPSPKRARRGPRALPKPAHTLLVSKVRPAPLYGHRQSVEAEWDGEWFPAMIQSAPMWCFGGWRYELLFADGGRVTFDPGSMESWNPSTSGQPETSIRQMPQTVTPQPMQTAKASRPRRKALPAEVQQTEYDHLNREALRALCRLHGLTVSGSADQLRERLSQAVPKVKLANKAPAVASGAESLDSVGREWLADPVGAVDSLLANLQTWPGSQLETYFARFHTTMCRLPATNTTALAICKLAVQVVKLEIQRRVWTAQQG